MPLRYTYLRLYLKTHLWLRERCERLSEGQRKTIVFGLSLVYLLCSLWMIAQFFLPYQEETELPIPVSSKEYIDAPIERSQGKPYPTNTHQISQYNG